MHKPTGYVGLRCTFENANDLTPEMHLIAFILQIMELRRAKEMTMTRTARRWVLRELVMSLPLPLPLPLRTRCQVSLLVPFSVSNSLQMSENQDAVCKF